MAVNPPARRLLSASPPLEPLGALKQCDKVNDAPAVALRLDLGLARELIAAARAGNQRPGDLYDFLFSAPNVRRFVAQLLLELPHSTLTSQQFAHFFSGHDVLAKASLEERAFVHSFYEDTRIAASSASGNG